jgi:multiple sugar transport system substrate-binding protein/sn-glycerol 3-phosphate transport system substrate-binding protein
MQKNKILLLGLLPVLLALLLSACSPGFPTLGPLVTNTPASLKKTATPAPTDQPRIGIEPEALAGLTIQVSYAFVDSSASHFDDQVAEFNTLNEWGIVVYPQANHSYNSLFGTVSDSLDTPEQPDLVITLPEQVLIWDEQAAVVDLTPYLQDPRFGFSDEDVADFAPIFWEIAGFDDRQLGLPAQISAAFLFYNQTWARELGFSRLPLTSADFRKQACAANQSFRSDTILQNDGYGGWIVNTSPQSVLAWMMASGGGLLEDDKYTFSSEANQSALEFLKKLYDDNCAYLTTEPNLYPSFVNRSALFITADLAEVSRQKLAFEQANNNDEWTVIPFPGQHTQLIAEGPVYSVLASTPEKQLAAWLFTRWLLSSENQSRWVVATGMFPLRTSAYESLSGYRSSHPQWDQAVKYMDSLAAQPQVASWRKARLVLGDATNFIFRNNLGLDQIPALLKQMDETVTELTEAQP